MIPRTCATCTHFKGYPGPDGVVFVGDCRRYPPVTIVEPGEPLFSDFPATYAADTCGEYALDYARCPACKGGGASPGCPECGLVGYTRDVAPPP